MSDEKHDKGLKDQIFRGVSGSRYVEIPEPSVKPELGKAAQGVSIAMTDEEVWDMCSELNREHDSNNLPHEGLELEGMLFEKI